MCRIQKYSFGIDAPTFYTGYCPFFWMTWLALLASPFVLAWKILAHLAGLTWDNLESHLEAREKRKAERNDQVPKPVRAVKPPPRIFEYMVEARDEYNVHPDYLSKWVFEYCGLRGFWKWRRHAYQQWFEENPRETWEADYNAAAERLLKEQKEAREEYKRIQQARKDRAERLKRMACRASVVGRGIARIAVFLAIACILYWIIIGGIWATNNPGVLLAYTIKTAAFIAATITVSLILFVIGKWWREYDPSPLLESLGRFQSPAERTCKVIGWPFQTGWKALLATGRAISNAAVFLATTIKLTYKAECPMIVWGEENTPIQKRGENDT